MSSSLIVPCIWMDRQAEQAAAFYASTFPGARTGAVSRYSETRDNPGGMPRGSVLTVEVELAGQRFTLLNGGPVFTPTPSVSFFVYVDTAPEADSLYKALAHGGKELMELGAYPWSERYGWVQDRFGVSWQVIAGVRPGPGVAPCLMFAGAQHGKAQAAMQLYTSVFPGGSIDAVERYTAAEGTEGTVKHGRFTLAGQPMVAMDSHIDHGFTFNEGISFQVMCASQRELDRTWDALSAQGEQGPCGWLKDRFGVSWQVVPEQMAAWMASGPPEARDRAFEAMLTMKKLDIAALDKAYRG